MKSHHYCVALLNAIVQKTKPVAPLSTAESNSYGIYLYACIYQLKVEDFVVENSHGHFTSSLNVFFDTVVIHVFPGTQEKSRFLRFSNYLVKSV